MLADKQRSDILWLIRTSLRRAEVDRAVLYGLLAIAFQIVAGPLTLLVVASTLSPVEQGFYYTFASLIALQGYAELGLSIVVLNAASHEWSRLQLDKTGAIVGDRQALSRLVSLGRFAARWYAVAALLFILLVGSVGHHFLATQNNADVSWRGPWWVLVAITAAQLWALPFNAMLEGCNQVLNVQKFRLSQIVLRTLALWLVFFSGGSLWAAVAAAAVALARDVYLLGIKYRRFFAPFFLPPLDGVMNWRSEILPMQWRLAISGSVGYLFFQIFTPVTFHYQGVVAAGQVGMTLAVVALVQGLAAPWLQPKVPIFGGLIATRDFTALNRIWWSTTRAVVLVATTVAVLAVTMLGLITYLGLPIASRLLPLPATSLFLAGAVSMAAGYCVTIYLRAHKREPLLVLSVTTAALMGGLVWATGSRIGTTAMAASYLFVTAGVTLPWQLLIMKRARQVWHSA